MSSTTTIAEFANELHKSVDALFEQLKAAGVAKHSAQDSLSEGDKQKLLRYLQASHGTISADRKKITLVKKSTGEIKRADATGKARTIQVEVQKKRTFVKRESGQAMQPVPAPAVKKLRIHTIQAKAFKAFRAFDFCLNGRHLLVYGGNGAGKSSLYWLLYTFLQSGQKKTEGVAKYFDPSHLKNLLHIHADANDQAAAHITVSLQENGQPPSTYTISANQHETKDVPDITKSNLASDFVTYRVLFNFYSFRHSERINLWPVFETEILPFCYTPGGANRPLGDAWREINDGYEALKIAVKPKGSAIASFDVLIDAFNNSLSEVLETISTRAQKFYDKYFSQDDAKPISLVVGVTQAVSFDIKEQLFDRPQIGFEVKAGNVKIESPHTFLNEAKLTQLALSVRFGATLVHLDVAPLKLLVLDDLLISLDMGNRMKVVDIILGETFEDYQKVILTHDRGFYQEFKRRIGTGHDDWSFQCFKGKPNAALGLHSDKSDLQKAEDYLAGHDLVAAAACLRRPAEAGAKRMRELLEDKKLPPDEFVSLTDNLKYAKNRLQEKLPRKLFEDALNGTPKLHRALLIPTDDSDLDAHPDLNPADRGRLKSQRKRLRKLFDEETWANIDTLVLVEKLLAMTDRVLNPAAHDNDSPHYANEIAEALEIIRQFGSCTPP